MATFTDMISKLGDKKENQGKSTDDLMNEQFNKLQSKVREQDRKIKSLEARNVPFSLDLDPNGTLRSYHGVKDTLNGGKIVQIPEELLNHEVLKVLSNLLRPLLGVAKAVYRSGKIVNNPLHMSPGSKELMKDVAGNQVYNSDPLSQLKAILHVLLHNEEAVKALQTIADVLSPYNPNKMKGLKVTQLDIKSNKAEIKPRFDLDDKIRMDKSSQISGPVFKYRDPEPQNDNVSNNLTFPSN